MVVVDRCPDRASKLTRAGVVAVLALFASAAHAAVSRELITNGFSSPVHVAAPPGDSTRLFVVQRGGLIRIINLSNNTILGTPFLNVSAGPETDVDTQGEGGLLSMAFHPDYASNGHIFVYYTTDLSGGSNVFGTRISRFTVSGNPNIADPASETVFLELTQPATNHNGGMVAFRPNDANHYLYVSLGDGGGGCDPGEKAQDITNKFGSILRIDVDPGPSGDVLNPFAPASNPFVGAPGDDLIWVFGLRNPYRFSFDRMTGDMYIGDVGQAAREEISFQAANSAGGENYGWDRFEGFLTPPSGCGTIASLPLKPPVIPPLHDYGRVDGQVVTGGNVYRGLDFNSLVGRYYFTDFGSGRFWSFVRNGAGITDLQDHSAALNPGGANISGFGEDATGELYFTNFSGEVWRIIDPASAPVDTDQDLLSDNDELTLGTDPNNPDTDGDGVIDGTEVFFGTDPNNPLDFPLLPILRGWALAATLALALIASGFWISRRRRVAR